MNVLITGGCGFIGTNVALRMFESGHEVTIFDLLARQGAERNLAVLETAGKRNSSFRFVRGDVAETSAVGSAVSSADIVFHLAAQVSVVDGIKDPLADFRSNAIGTFNVLEAARLSGRKPIVLIASTNKVYGGLDRYCPAEEETRWTLPECPHGISELETLNPITPYACSKAAGDLYAMDYARTFGVRTVIFRQSCIYGKYQQATEEQAWVAWFIKAALSDQPITIFGDGKQVRDLLHVNDLVDAYEDAIASIDRVAGMAFNIGGGPGMTLSIWNEFGDWLQNALGERISVAYNSSRIGDQRVFVSDTRLAQAKLGWRPRIGMRDGLADLVSWLRKESSAWAHL